jgi:hypothetical protein
MSSGLYDRHSVKSKRDGEKTEAKFQAGQDDVRTQFPAQVKSKGQDESRKMAGRKMAPAFIFLPDIFLLSMTCTCDLAEELLPGGLCRRCAPASTHQFHDRLSRADFAQLDDIAPHFRRFGEAGIDAFDQPLGVTGKRFGQTVMNPQTVFAVADQSCAFQIGQMARDLWLVSVEYVNQMADADLAFRRQQVDQPQSRLVGAGLQESRHLRRQLVSG